MEERMSVLHPAAPTRQLPSQTVLPAPSGKLDREETSAFLLWLRQDAEASVLRAALRRYDASGRVTSLIPSAAASR